jgi:hypothetical protein
MEYDRDTGKSYHLSKTLPATCSQMENSILKLISPSNKLRDKYCLLIFNKKNMKILSRGK